VSDAPMTSGGPQAPSPNPVGPESAPPAKTDAAASTPPTTPVVEAVSPSTAAPGAQAASQGPQAGKSPYVWGTGRRKTAVARVRIMPGTGKFEIDRRGVNEYFFDEQGRRDVMAPLAATNAQDKFDVFVNVRGGGQTGQAGAIMLGIARALVKADAAFEPPLRDGNYLTRDSREVERKKPGRPGARKRFQFSKR